MRLSTEYPLMLVCALLCSVVISSSVHAQGEPLPGTEFPSVGGIVTPPNDISATYDAATGEVYIGINGLFQVFGLEGAPFLLGNLDESTPFGIPTQQDGIGIPPQPNVGIGFLSLAGFPQGVFNIGNILPADPSIRTAARLAEVYPDLVISGGNAGIPGVGRRFNVIPAAIPEPGTLLSLSVVSTLALMRRRRR